jgi:thiol:disulfide interchange protein DsbC
MLVIRLTSTMLLAVVLFSTAHAADDNWEVRLKEQVRTNTAGKVRPDAIATTPIAGIFEIRAGLDIFYVDGSGQYAFVEGHLLDLKAGRDLTRERLEAAARVDFNSLPFDLALKTVRGSGKRRLAVFEDPSCPYCRALHTLLGQLEDVTIYTFPYPVLSADSDAKARAALCSTDRDKAWSELMMTGKAPPAKPCKSSVDQIIELGNRLSIRGTPTVFFADGRRAQGAVPPDQFMAMFLQAQP